MAAYLAIHDSERLKAKIADKRHNLFRARAGEPQLQVTRLSRITTPEGRESNVFLEQDVSNGSRLEELATNTEDLSQIFVVRHRRSWTTLDISFELFESFLNHFNVFPRFWNYTFMFGRKSEENEFQFPGFRAHTSRSFGASTPCVCESAYILRRVDLNQRRVEDGMSPWTIRQTAVYHKLGLDDDQPLDIMPENSTRSSGPTSTFLLIAPSVTFERQLGQCLRLSLQEDSAVLPWDVHRMLIADSLANWIDYLAYLEEQVRETSDSMVLASVAPRERSSGIFKDFALDFNTPQNLRIIEDSVIDLQVILPTISDTISRLRDHCKRCGNMSTMSGEEMSRVELILNEFDEHSKEADLLVGRAKSLSARTQATATLYWNFLNGDQNVAMKDLASEQQQENKLTYELTKKSTQDAAAVKILTIITLVYLPTTIIANFFSTQFVQTDENYHMRISPKVWILAAVSVPLTLFTLSLWWIVVRFSKVTPPEPEKVDTLQHRRIQNSFRSYAARRIQPENVADPPPIPGTWSSTAGMLPRDPESLAN